MSAPAIISGDFSTFRHVQGRKVLQLVIEIPAEQAASVFSTFGYPGSGNPIPVAVARLVAEHVTPDSDTTSDQTGPQRRTFSELPLAQQAALRCQEPDFWRFLQERQGPDGVLHLRGDVKNQCAAHVRFLCGVDSRSDIGKGPNDRSANDSGFKWRALDAEYFAWQRGRR